jgi:hypothetical protein
VLDTSETEEYTTQFDVFHKMLMREGWEKVGHEMEIMK